MSTITIIEEQDPIVVIGTALTTPKEEVFAKANNDPKLVRAIEFTSEQLAKKGVETFERKDNIIVTDQGYFLAFRAEELVEMGMMERVDPDNPETQD
jgi:hypothetical protein